MVKEVVGSLDGSWCRLWRHGGGGGGRCGLPHPHGKMRARKVDRNASLKNGQTDFRMVLLKCFFPRTIFSLNVIFNALCFVLLFIKLNYHLIYLLLLQNYNAK